MLGVVPEQARATWTDERLDDLARGMEAGFARIDEDIRSLRVDLGSRIDRQGAGLNARIDALQRTMLAMMVTILVGFAGLIATQL
jgi:hypothetical protein